MEEHRLGGVWGESVERIFGPRADFNNKGLGGIFDDLGL